nr:MAG TPA: leucine-rich repeat protein [Caudoviricetes sp.]
MAISKVNYGDQTLIDLTSDSVSESTLLKGVTAHNAAGEQITGTYEPGTPAEEKQPGYITFFDYDGTIVEAWSKAELATKTELPTPPAHDGLVFQGWAWTLAQINQARREVNVGPFYKTESNKTEIHITLPSSNIYRRRPMLGIALKGTATIDWGDGTAATTLTGTAVTSVVYTDRHTYPAAGDYVITITASVAFALLSPTHTSCLLRDSATDSDLNQFYASCIKEVYFDATAARVLQIGAFRGCSNLKIVSFASLTRMLQNYVFEDCSSIEFVHARTNSQILLGSFLNCYNLKHVALVPNNNYFFANCFQNCITLNEIMLQTGVTSIAEGAFSGCKFLTSVYIPPTVTTINAKCFENCVGVKRFDFFDFTEMPTLVNVNAFDGISSDAEIVFNTGLEEEVSNDPDWGQLSAYLVFEG